jgi:hypothetical protein
MIMAPADALAAELVTTAANIRMIARALDTLRPNSGLTQPTARGRWGARLSRHDITRFLTSKWTLAGTLRMVSLFMLSYAGYLTIVR